MNNEITLGTEMHFFKFFIADKNNEDLSEKGFLSRRKKKFAWFKESQNTELALYSHSWSIFKKYIDKQ